MARQQSIPDTLPEISEKSKKNEILAAYQELLEQIGQTKQESHQEEKKKQQEQEVVATASTMTPDRIVKNIAEVKVSIGQALDTLEQRLTDEYRGLSELQAAIKIETARLKDLHEITINADSLAALLLAQKEYKIRFEQEMMGRKVQFEDQMAEAKTAWDKEQERMQQEQKELKESIKRTRVREEEEYDYALQLERKKDQDSYETKKFALEKELVEQKEAFYKECAEREAALKSQEEELKQMRSRVEQFPHELEKSVRETEKTTREQLERTYKYQIDLSAKEIDGERKLNQQMIGTLQAKIKEQELFIKQLTQKTDEASSQVQTIALKALDSSSNMRFMGSFEEGKKANQSNG
jgi:hypothetical protein